MTANEQAPLQHEIILYATPDGNVRVEVLFESESFWLTQKKMAELFGVESHTITYHLQETYKSNELNNVATTRKIRVVQTEGVRTVAREVDFYNLDAIISRSRTSMSNAASTTTRMRRSRRFSSRQCRTSCIGRSPARPRRS
jgi:hypothetical protein